jgi:hypothetical protein
VKRVVIMLALLAIACDSERDQAMEDSATVTRLVEDLERCSADTLTTSMARCLASGGRSVFILDDTGKADSSSARDSSAHLN